MYVCRSIHTVPGSTVGLSCAGGFLEDGKKHKKKKKKETGSKDERPECPRLSLRTNPRGVSVTEPGRYLSLSACSTLSISTSTTVATQANYVRSHGRTVFSCFLFFFFLFRVFFVPFQMNESPPNITDKLVLGIYRLNVLGFLGVCGRV